MRKHGLWITPSGETISSPSKSHFEMYMDWLKSHDKKEYEKTLREVEDLDDRDEIRNAVCFPVIAEKKWIRVDFPDAIQFHKDSFARAQKWVNENDYGTHSLHVAVVFTLQHMNRLAHMNREYDMDKRRFITARGVSDLERMMNDYDRSDESWSGRGKDCRDVFEGNPETKKNWQAYKKQHTPPDADEHPWKDPNPPVRPALLHRVIAGSHTSSNFTTLMRTGFEPRGLGISFARVPGERLTSPTSDDAKDDYGVVFVEIRGDGLDYQQPAHKEYLENLYAWVWSFGKPPWDIAVLNHLRKEGVQWVNNWHSMGMGREIHVLDASTIRIVKSMPLSAAHRLGRTRAQGKAKWYDSDRNGW